MGFFHDNVPFSPPLDRSNNSFYNKIQASRTLSPKSAFIGLANQGKGRILCLDWLESIDA
jgi:hypothetical protein